MPTYARQCPAPRRPNPYRPCITCSCRPCESSGVHIAARISELADPGEIWVLRIVKHLVAESGLRLEERAAHRLKGIDEGWALYAATAQLLHRALARMTGMTSRLARRTLRPGLL